MNERIQKTYMETKKKIESLEEEMKKITAKNFHEFTRKEQELQKLKRQIAKIESYVRHTAKPPPPVDLYSPYQISPQKLMMNTVIQQPVKPPFLPPSMPESTTFFGKKDKEPNKAVSQTSPSEKQDTPKKPPSQLMVSFEEDVPVFQRSEGEIVPEILEFGSEENSEKEFPEEQPEEDYSEEDSEKEYADLSVLMASHDGSPVTRNGRAGEGAENKKARNRSSRPCQAILRISLLSFFVLLFSNAIVSPACR
ncbi:hypothetical protein VNO80_09339 [Phaseolus coccineus]|uniref:Uncharacterized protein n=1 Tax=Phaseolus coccineus TaxID=3886 RepID=A0AAN9N6B0_PHACN